MLRTSAGQKDLAECPICEKNLTRYNLKAHMATHTDAVAAHCDLCDKDFKQASDYQYHYETFAYEHECVKNGNKYSCALDERLAGDSDNRNEKQLFDEFRALYSQQTLKYSALYVLFEVSAAAEATSDGTFSAFIDKIFYVGWTEGITSRLLHHQSSKYESPAKIEKMRAIWASGDSVHMIVIDGLAREEAQLAEGATIDAIGTRNLVNEHRGLSLTAGKVYGSDRRSFALIGARFLELLHAAARDGKVRILQSLDSAASI